MAEAAVAEGAVEAAMMMATAPRTTAATAMDSATAAGSSPAQDYSVPAAGLEAATIAEEEASGCR